MAVRRGANGERLRVESRAIFYNTLSLFIGRRKIIVTNNTWKGI